MSLTLMFVLLLGVTLGSAITNNNNNFGSGGHTNNNNNMGSGGHTNNNNNMGSGGFTNNNNNMGSGSNTNNNNNYGGDDDDDDDYDDDFYDNPYYFYSYSHRNRHRPRPQHSKDIVNNNGGSLGKVHGKCRYGSITNNNGPGDVQVVCLPKGVPSTVNNNGR